ncbi:sulfur carrier protein ThiS [Seleniivibrio woodruffii]|uniref:sulfur carrier protein ThiS n=2 Tax=Seleniivibrio woodruffii TaxID=1078050 RepID=UPI002409EB30|nr:sulfur carrier protein ThiS [Seleniivibrio woodruffii]
MKIILNGDAVELERAYTISELITKYDMKKETVVVELNGDLPDKATYDETFTKEGDKIELIRFVGGG